MAVELSFQAEARTLTAAELKTVAKDPSARLNLAELRLLAWREARSFPTSPVDMPPHPTWEVIHALEFILRQRWSETHTEGWLAAFLARFPGTGLDALAIAWDAVPTAALAVGAPLGLRMYSVPEGYFRLRDAEPADLPARVTFLLDADHRGVIDGPSDPVAVEGLAVMRLELLGQPGLDLVWARLEALAGPRPEYVRHALPDAVYLSLVFGDPRATDLTPTVAAVLDADTTRMLEVRRRKRPFRAGQRRPRMLSGGGLNEPLVLAPP